MSLADWVHEALDHACRREYRGNANKKLAAIRAAARFNFPTSDVDRMLAEIEQGYGSRQQV